MPGTNTRRFVPPAILEELKHLDLTERVRVAQAEEYTLVNGGSFGDILKSKCHIEGRGEVPIAIKRLRFYLKEDIVTVCTLAAFSCLLTLELL